MTKGTSISVLGPETLVTLGMTCQDVEDALLLRVGVTQAAHVWSKISLRYACIRAFPTMHNFALRRAVEEHDH